MCINQRNPCIILRLFQRLKQPGCLLYPLLLNNDNQVKWRLKPQSNVCFDEFWWLLLIFDGDVQQVHLRRGIIICGSFPLKTHHMSKFLKVIGFKMSSIISSDHDRNTISTHLYADNAILTVSTVIITKGMTSDHLVKSIDYS